MNIIIAVKFGRLKGIMQKIINLTFDEERALYALKDAEVDLCIFDGPADGESAFKECRDINVTNSYFNLRYPFWHNKSTIIKNCEFTVNCRAALWYCDEIFVKDCIMNGIKAFRECTDVALDRVSADSPEYFWRCKGINIKKSIIKSEYPFFECSNIFIDRLDMTGKYSFQYVENAVIENSVLNTKDAFWHSKNVTVRDSIVRGEYLGWYSENLHLIRCKIIGTQPLCYCKGLVLEDCETEGCDLSFERSEVKALINGEIESIKNPAPKSVIEADKIGEIILEKDFCEPDKVTIHTK